MLICENDKIGKGCVDSRREDAGPRQDDCIQKAYWECLKEVWKCRSSLIGTDNDNTRISNEINMSLNATDQKRAAGNYGVGRSYLPALNDPKCYSDRCYHQLKTCYCTGLSGMNCTSCGDKPGGFNQFPTPTPDGEDDGKDKFNTQSVTLSDTGVNIPIIFGKVHLTGNVTYFSEPYFRPLMSADDLLVSAVDFVLSLCEGVVKDTPRIWAGGVLTYDKTTDQKSSSSYMDSNKYTMELIHGSESEPVRPIAGIPFGRQPAYRGQAAIIFRNYPALEIAGSLPSMRVECVTDTEPHAALSTTPTIDVLVNEFRIDSISGRYMFVDDSTITFGYLSETGEVNSYESPSAIGKIQWTEDEKDIVYQDADLNLHFVSGYSFDEDFTVTLMSEANTVCGYRIPSYAQQDMRVAAVTSGNVIEFYTLKKATYQLELAKTLTNPNLLKYDFSIMSSFGDDNTEHILYCLGTGESTVYFDRLFLYDVVNGKDYDEMDSIISIAVPLINLGCASAVATIDKVVHIKNGNAFLIFFNDAGKKVVSLVSHENLSTVIWSGEIAKAPTSGADTHFEGDIYRFLADGYVFTIRLSDGVITSTPMEEAPVFAGAQAYDGLFDSIYYVNSSKRITRYIPDRAVTIPATMDEVVEGICTRAGMQVVDIDTSLVKTMDVRGFLIQEQANGAECFAELNEFYSMITRETTSGFQALRIADASVISIDEEDYSQLVSKERTIVDKYEASYATIAYYNDLNDGYPDAQTVTKDFITGDDSDDDMANGDSYSVNVYATPTEARQSAEVHLIKELQEATAYTVNLLPRYLAIEAGDFISLVDGSSALIHKMSLDTPLAIKLEGNQDSITFYQEETSLVGLGPIAENELFEQPVEKPNFILRFNAPLPKEFTMDGMRQEAIWIGQINPDNVDFSAVDQYIKDSDGTYYLRDKPSEPVVLGKLTNGFAYPIHNEFTKDKLNTITIQFSREVPIDLFSSALNTDLYDSFTRNLLYVGQELIQFTDFEVLGDNRTVVFSGLYRGRFGTDRFKDRHVTGEQCVYYTEESIKFEIVPSDYTEKHYVDVALKDAFYPTRTKAVDSCYRTLLTMYWPIASIKIMSGFWGWMEPPRLRPDVWNPGSLTWVRTFPIERGAIEPYAVDRVPYMQSFHDETDDTYYNNPNIFFLLTEPYDEQTFVEKYDADKLWTVPPTFSGAYNRERWKNSTYIRDATTEGSLFNTTPDVANSDVTLHCVVGITHEVQNLGPPDFVADLSHLELKETIDYPGARGFVIERAHNRVFYKQQYRNNNMWDPSPTRGRWLNAWSYASLPTDEYIIGYASTPGQTPIPSIGLLVSCDTVWIETLREIP